jgi:eukaryotic-like serine/threonine-protein kinase
MENQQAFAERLFGEALDLPREERAAFVARACLDAPRVKRLVEALLEENDKLSGFLSTPPYKKANETTVNFVAPGTRLGRYTIVDQLGAGGMGVVYRARDEKLEREVAIKMVSKGVLATEEARRHFRREALALAKLNHPRIASVYDVGEQDGADFLVMELVQGQSLAAKLRVGPLPVNEATAIARQVAEALGEAHEQGVIHRDLKPANVMITPKGDAKVLDFGLAKLLASGLDATMSVAETRGLLGTPVYMSPEQALGKGVDARTDLWSLGVLYYESLAGRPPFVRNSSIDVLHAITSEPLPSIRAIRPELPALAEHIVNRALEKDRDLRYQRAAEMETDLKRLARDLDPGLALSHGSSVTAPNAKGAQRRRGRVAMLAALGLILVLVPAYLLRPTVPPPRVLGIKQITHDGVPKLAPGVFVHSAMATDGLRVYFQLPSPTDILLMQVSVDGGEAERVPIPFTVESFAGLSPKKSDLLLAGPPKNPSLEVAGLWEMPVLGGQARRIGNLSAFDATWSPDGASIYYAAGSDIWTARSDGSQPRKILTMSGQPNWIRFSPDGKLFRFSVFDERLNTSTLWETRTDGTGVRRLLVNDASWQNLCCGTWTTDGKYFVFQSMHGTTSTLWAVRERRDWWQKANSDPVQLATGTMITQSPLPGLDGKSIFFIGATPRGELERFDKDKQTFVPFLPGVSAGWLGFSRDGAKLAYVTVPEGNLWQSNADGSNRRELTFPGMEIEVPNWSPDGKMIVFCGRQLGNPWKVYLIPSDGGIPEQVTQGDQDDNGAMWSANGDAISFGGSFESAVSSRSHPIQILNLKTRGLTSLPDSNGYVVPAWSPDGRWMLATDPHSSRMELYDFKTRRWEELSKWETADANWTGDSKCILFNDFKTTEYRICLKDRKPERVADLTQVGPILPGRSWTGISPDGSLLALHDTSHSEIYVLDLDLP